MESRLTRTNATATSTARESKEALRMNLVMFNSQDKFGAIV
jgi:hypothetical protein